MKNVINNKDSQYKNKPQNGQENNNIIAFRLGKKSLIPLLDKVADVANISRTQAAKIILIDFLIDFLIDYRERSLKESDKNKELNLPEPSPLEPFINTHSTKMYCGILFREAKANKLKEDLAKTKNSEECGGDI